MAPRYTLLKQEHQQQQQPRRSATLALSLATLLLYLGYVIAAVAAHLDDGSAMLQAGGITFLVGCALYVPGFVLYRRNSGQPSFVGYVVRYGARPLQQMAETYGPAVHNPQMAWPEEPVASFDNPPSYEQTTALPVKLYDTHS